MVAPPNLLRGPTPDSADLASFLKTIPGPIVLVGHSYGGFVITNAATGNPNVKALVYIDAFIPDQGEVLGVLDAGSGLDPATAFNAVPLSSGETDLYLRIACRIRRTRASPSASPTASTASQTAQLAAAQRPAALTELGQPSGPPAWKSIPSWSLIGTADHVIVPAQQEFMSNRAGAHISKVDAGHLSLITRPADVTRVILSAVDGTTLSDRSTSRSPALVGG